MLKNAEAENKLNLTSNAIEKLGAVAGDRISVNY